MRTLYANVLVAYRYRWLLYELVKRDLILRYRGSVLGFAWTLLNPILFMLIYTLIFAVYLKSSIQHFPVYLLAGMIPWMWLSGSIGQAVSAVLDGRMYIGKTLMPIELLVLVPVLSNGVNFLITMALFFPVAIIYGANVAWALLFLPALVAVELCVTLGLSLIVATLNVFYRDFQQVLGYLLTAGFFLTPIFYARANVPQNFQFLVTFSPFAALIAPFQNVFYYGVPPDWRDLLFAAVFGAIVLLIGLAYFNRYRESFAEYV
ncbi:MAG: ABC transporter permease [Candidatus Eremiobacteraeota bacterium]|nr:ABC transporter permease [Candidatus Eremiobacteraeota bacterium]